MAWWPVPSPCSRRLTSFARHTGRHLAFARHVPVLFFQSLNSGARLAMLAIIDSCRSFDINIAAFQVAL